jgi:hypothetical protein
MPGYGLGFDSRQGQEIFLYCTWSRPALGPTQPPTQWVSREGLVVKSFWLQIQIDVPGSIPSPNTFSEKYGIWNGVYSATCGQLRSYLNEKKK